MSAVADVATRQQRARTRSERHFDAKKNLTPKVQKYLETEKKKDVKTKNTSKTVVKRKRDSAVDDRDASAVQKTAMKDYATSAATKDNTTTENDMQPRKKARFFGEQAKKLVTYNRKLRTSTAKKTDSTAKNTDSSNRVRIIREEGRAVKGEKGYKGKNEKNRPEEQNRTDAQFTVHVQHRVVAGGADELQLTSCVLLPNCCSICNEEFAPSPLAAEPNNVPQKRRHAIADFVQNGKHFPDDLPLSVAGNSAVEEKDAETRDVVWTSAICPWKAPYTHLMRDNTEKARLLCKIAKCESGAALDEIRNRLARVCTVCFDRSFVAHSEKSGAFRFSASSMSPQTVQITCPFCVRTHVHTCNTDALMRALGATARTTVQRALDREFVSHNFPTFQCAVFGCSHSELRMRDGKVLPFLHCARHGVQCTRCWDVVPVDGQQKHSQSDCTGLPKELRDLPAAADIRRCPHCWLSMQRNQGCPNMTCRCGKQFNWDTAERVDRKQEQKEQQQSGEQQRINLHRIVSQQRELQLHEQREQQQRGEQLQRGGATRATATTLTIPTPMRRLPPLLSAALSRREESSEEEEEEEDAADLEDFIVPDSESSESDEESEE